MVILKVIYIYFQNELPFEGICAGSVYIFNYYGECWTEIMKLVAEDGVAGDRFGNTVSLYSGTIAVGVSLQDINGVESG